MKQTTTWLLIAVLLAFLTPGAVIAAEGEGFSSSVEVGAAGMSVDDQANKVNEYTSISRDDDDVKPYVKANLSGSNNGAQIAVDAEVTGEDVMDIDLDVDASRIFRFDAGYGEYYHLLSHDQLDYMDATMKTQGQTAGPASANPSIYGEDLVPDQDFFMIHKQFEANGEVVIPDLPNVTLKTGYRLEKRTGVKQVFGISHCSSCHVEGDAKGVDESTTDVTLGATGKFGMLTIDYEYLTRDFDDDSAATTRTYLDAYKPFPNPGDYVGGYGDPFDANRLLFDMSNGPVPYATTPDSQKDSHTVKARVDMSKDAVISAGYVHAEMESSKQDDVGMTLENNKLSTDYDSYNLRASKRLGNWRLTGYGRREELDADDNILAFTYGDGGSVPITEERATYQSEEARDVTTLGGNAIYRINSGTSLRLGYEYEDIDRDIEEAQDTTSHTLKASMRFRPTNKLNGRVSYTYESIDDQFMNPHGNKGPIVAYGPAGETILYDSANKLYYIENGTGNIIDVPPPGPNWYGTAFYSEREAEATSLPEDVHDVKASTTWTPAAHYSVTVYARYRHEENDLNFNTYKKDVVSPGFNLWWAPINKLNMTMAYNFDKQKTENQMCVGWYHG